MEQFSICYDNIIKSNWLTDATRKLAFERTLNPYMSVGDYLKNLDGSSLDQFIELANREDDDAFSELMLVSEILSRSEGVFTENMDILAENIGYLKMLIASVSLARKGIVKVNYENISFARDMMDKIIVERIDGDEEA